MPKGLDSKAENGFQMMSDSFPALKSDGIEHLYITVPHNNSICGNRERDTVGAWIGIRQNQIPIIRESKGDRKFYTGKE